MEKEDKPGIGGDVEEETEQTQGTKETEEMKETQETERTEATEEMNGTVEIEWTEETEEIEKREESQETVETGETTERYEWYNDKTPPLRGTHAGPGRRLLLIRLQREGWQHGGCVGRGGGRQGNYTSLRTRVEPRQFAAQAQLWSLELQHFTHIGTVYLLHPRKVRRPNVAAVAERS